MLPSIWILIRVTIISKYANAELETFISWEYLNIVLEVIQESVLLPLFWWLAKISKDKEDIKKIQEVYILIFILFLLILFIISFFTSHLINSVGMDGDSQIIFFLLQLWSRLPTILFSISLIIMIKMNLNIAVILCLITKIILMVAFDLTLANKDVFLNSYIGIGISTLITETTVFIISIFVIAKHFGFKDFLKINKQSFKVSNLKINRQLVINVLSCFVLSFVNNFLYMFMVLKNINLSNAATSYWLSNTIIWQWILIIPNALILISKDIISKESKVNLTNKKRLFILMEFICLSLASLLLMTLIFGLTFKPIANVISNNNPGVSFNIFIFTIWFFISYIICQNINVIFIAEGKNHILLISGIISNICIYVPYIVLSACDIIDMNLETTIIMFSTGLIISTIVAVPALAIYLKREKKKWVEKNSQAK
ncbi:hypothetical protein [Spiroplasma endosymbiont of Othius punctulatus]|uniref:hypothetical protein n=1 Tax=Spiroplasma endosymbiont of Othius punctulatus TaxID=3066289 RepID=UPI0030D18F02